MFRVRLDAHYVARSVPDDGSPRRPRDFPYVLHGVDAGLADVLRILNSHGYPTMASMSGLLADYPQSKEGAECGYIAFLKMTPASHKRVLTAASQCGLGHRAVRPGAWGRGVRVDTALLRDGTPFGELQDRMLADLRGSGISWRGQPSGSELAPIEAAHTARILQHGGLLGDDEVIDLWRCFTGRLTGEAATVF